MGATRAYSLIGLSSRGSTRCLVAALAVLAVAGCGGSVAPNPVAPDAPAVTRPAPVATTLRANSSLDQTGWPGAYVTERPSVIVRDQYGAPMPNVPVHFAAAASGGDVANAVQITSSAGVAMYGPWLLGQSPGQNRVVASVDGAGSVEFTASGRMPSIVARYDLQTIGGQPLPLTFSAGSTSWDIVGARYILSADGTYGWGYLVRRYVGGVASVDSALFTGTYARPNSTTTQFFEGNGILFSTGTLQGDVLTVIYVDGVDFDNEVYVRSR